MKASKNMNYMYNKFFEFFIKFIITIVKQWDHVPRKALNHYTVLKYRKFSIIFEKLNYFFIILYKKKILLNQLY